MKKTLIFSILLSALVVPAAAHAQLNLFTLKAPAAKAPVSTPASAVTPAPTASVSAETTTDDLGITDLQNQPLFIRRQVVATQLSDIELKLSTLNDKAKSAADRLAQNGIATDKAQLELSNATLTLAQAKLSIDALVAVANDPKNVTATTLAVDNVPFKDAVIKAEDLLRTARQSIIDSLVALKASVSASVSTN